MPGGSKYRMGKEAAVGKIYSGTGDQGETDLPGGIRVPKHDLRLEVCGAIDELQSALGLARAHGLPQSLEKILPEVQQQLCILAAEVAGVDVAGRGLEPIGPKHVQTLENWIDEYTSRGVQSSGFILPGGCLGAAHLDFARAVCRRAERRLVALHHQTSPQSIAPPLDNSAEASTSSAAMTSPPTTALPQSTALWGLAYLNRLSDLLFVLARAANAEAGRAEDEFRPC